ncbi:hypothetical protein BHE74_00014682 [Ensete ventricosum]|nr:hypothetical protein BHE74_00014682 [Ensete ventricosum]
MAVQFKVCNFDIYRPVRAVHIGPPGCRYADHPLLSGSAKKSAVSDRLKGEINRRRSIEGEINRRRSIERKKGKKKKRKKKKKKEKRRKRIPIARARSSPVRRHCSRAVAARGSRALFLPRGEKDRGDRKREEEEEEKKKEEEKKNTSPTRCRRPRVAHAPSAPTSRPQAVAARGAPASRHPRVTHAPSAPTGRPQAVAARGAPASDFSPARGERSRRNRPFLLF